MGVRAIQYVFISLTLLLAACGQPGSNSQPAPSATAWSVPQEEANQMIAGAQLTCEGACPAAVGMLITRLPGDRGLIRFEQCTGFLVTPDTVATNAHCLPKYMRKAGARCLPVTLYFGVDGTPTPEAIPCERVVSSTQISDIGADDYDQKTDVAFLKLQRAVNRQPLPLSRRGFADGEPMTAIVVDPSHERTQIHGVIRTRSCTMAQNAITTPGFTTDGARVATAECHLIPGNSGSPTLAADGSVRGIIHGVSDALKSHMKFRGFQMPSKFNDVSLVSNMACVEAPFDIGPQPAACSAPAPPADSWARVVMRTSKNDASSLFANWGHTQQLGYELHTESDVSYPTPTCISRYTNQDSFTIVLPVWGQKPTLDADRRLSTPIGVIDKLDMTVTLSLKQMSQDGFARVTTTYKSENGIVHIDSTPYDLPYCAN